MTHPRRRSKRQLYLGIFFVSLAILVALGRSFLGPAPGSPNAAVRATEYVGVTTEDAVRQFGEPTSRAEFYPDETFNPERTALLNRLRADGREVPEVFLELAWFNEDEILTIRFPAAFDEAGRPAPIGPSLDATRRPRMTGGNSSGQ